MYFKVDSLSKSHTSLVSKSSCESFLILLSIESSILWLKTNSSPSHLIWVHTSVGIVQSEPRFQNEWHCCMKHFCSDHMIKGWTWGRLCFFCITSLRTSLNPLPFIASPPPKCLFFWKFPAEFLLLRLRFICWFGGCYGSTQWGLRCFTEPFVCLVSLSPSRALWSRRHC